MGLQVFTMTSEPMCHMPTLTLTVEFHFFINTLKQSLSVIPILHRMFLSLRVGKNLATFRHVFGSNRKHDGSQTSV